MKTRPIAPKLDEYNLRAQFFSRSIRNRVSYTACCTLCYRLAKRSEYHNIFKYPNRQTKQYTWTEKIYQFDTGTVTGDKEKQIFVNDEERHIL